MEALLEKHRQWLLQQNLRFVAQQQQLREQQQKFLDSLHQRMLELLKSVVDEEEEVSNDDCCDEHHPLADALQVFDENPKRNAQIKPGELVGEGQEKLLEGSEVVAGEPLDVADTRLEQAGVDHWGRGTHKPSWGRGVVTPLEGVSPAEAFQVFDESPKKNPYALSHELIGESRTEFPAISVIVSADCGSLLLANPSKKGLSFVVPFQELKLSGCEDRHDGIKAIEQCWKNRGWKWTKSSSFVAFDPGGEVFCFKQRPQGRNVCSAVKVVETASCFSAVLEYVPSPVATATTSALGIPTTGNGAGPFCSGQVLAYHVLLGMIQHHHQDVISDGNFSVSKSMLESELKPWAYSMDFDGSMKNNPNLNTDQHPSLYDCGWDYCTEEQLDEMFLYNAAISKLVALGNDKDASWKAVLREGHCCGEMDVLTNVLHNSLSYLNIGSCENDGGSEESELVFTNLRQLQLNQGDVMWCLLMSDLQKVELASLYMVGKAKTWYNGYVFGRQNVPYEFIKLRQIFDFSNLTWSSQHSCKVEVTYPVTKVLTVRQEKVWNYAIGDIAFLAFGTSFPRISIATIDAIRNMGNIYAGGLGPGTLVGSAAFDLFPIHAVCVVPKARELKKISDIGVWLVGLFWSFWACIWLYMILKVWTPDLVTPTDSLSTVLQYGWLLLHAYAQDKRLPDLSLPLARSNRPLEWVPKEPAPQEHGKLTEDYFDLHQDADLEGDDTVEHVTFLSLWREQCFLSTGEDHKAPVIAECALKIAWEMIERCQTLPGTPCRIQFIILAGGKFLWHFFQVFISRRKSMEFHAYDSDETLVRICQLTNVVQYSEFTLREWDDNIDLLELELAKKGLDIDSRDVATDSSSFFKEEIQSLVEMETNWIMEAITQVLREFENLPFYYSNNADRFEISSSNQNATADPIISDDFLEPLDNLRSQLLLIRKHFNATDFLDVWRSVSQGTDLFADSCIGVTSGDAAESTLLKSFPAISGHHMLVWRESVAKYLIEDIPSLLKSTSMKNVAEAIYVVCMSLPSNFRDFLKRVAEVRKTEDNGESLSKVEIRQLMLKDDLLKQVQETGLYNYVTKFLSSAYTCARKAAKLGPEETLSDAAAADVHTIYKLEAVSVVFDPGGGKLVAAHIQSWMPGTAAVEMVKRRHVAAVLYHALRVGLNEDQACWELRKRCKPLSLSLEDKALKGGALMQDFPIYTHFQLIFHFCLNVYFDKVGFGELA